jgi:hypothetical protein
MTGPLSWWANRKSRMGMKPSAKAPPPHSPRKPWWTDPPTTPPPPEQIEYVSAFMSELIAMKPNTPQENREKDAMLRYIGAWMRAARRLLHEVRSSPDRADLTTTDGLIVAASSALQKMNSRIYGLGGEVDKEVREVMDVIQGRADRIRRERALVITRKRSA